MALDGVGLWRSPGALGRFYVPRRVQEVEELWGKLGQHPDFAETALVESDQGLTTGGQEPVGVHVEAVANGFRLELDHPSPEPVVVASAVSWAPGWRAHAPGPHAPRAVRLNGALLGVVVPAETTRIALDYRPRGWELGLVVAAVGLLITVWLGWSGMRQPVAPSTL